MIENVTINGMHCLSDLGLYLTDADIGMPDLQNTYVSVPGREGFLDLSTALDGEIHYKERKITLTFANGTGHRWAETIAAFNALVHGNELQLVFDSDPDYYYSGRGTVSSMTRNGNKLTIKLVATCQPYKTKLLPTTIYRTLSSTQVSIALTNNGKPVIPSITVTDSATLVFGDYTTTLSAGTWTVPSIRLASGANTIKAKGSGKVTFTWNEVAL